MKKQDNTGQKFPKYSKKLRNTGQKPRKYHLCVKNENINNKRILLKNDQKYKRIQMSAI